MRTLLRIARAVAVFLAMFVSTTHIAGAAPSATPYSLSLSLGQGWNLTSTGLPKTTVTFKNSSPHTVAFFLTSAFSHFTVEYKVVKDEAASRTGWQMLRPIHQTSPSNASPGKPAAADTETFDILFRFAPKQENKTEYEVSDFPMSAAGLYRITAFTKVPNVSELDGPASLPTVVRTFTLDIHSNSIIIRRTATGFVEVPAPTNKQALAK